MGRAQRMRLSLADRFYSMQMMVPEEKSLGSSVGFSASRRPRVVRSDAARESSVSSGRIV